ncbi:uncharacterized protein BDV17DRAFT_294762 [Aspergillus undulatus]|uniref:uncharacterized protein n=1 Tax=Aspergillus undulatus TaxID=1810928 RepID=UPI003CCE184A
MDHLLPLATPRNHLEIPYFAGTVYDCRGFFSYPERQNWDFWALRDGRYGSRSATEAASFAQAWLFFGALSQITEIRIRGTGLIRASPTTGDLIITTERLNYYLDAWRIRTTRDTPDGRKQSLRIAKICLEFILQYTTPILIVPEHPEVAVSIEILLITLFKTLGEIYGDRAWDTVPAAFANSNDNIWSFPGGNQHVIRYLKERMIKLGWCPHRLANFGIFILSDTLYTLSLMGARDLFVGHKECDIDICVGNQIDDQTYNNTPRHGKIPVARIVVDNEQRVRLDVTPYEEGKTYIAISHVWSHGLGNPDYNALRACQLLQLNKLVKNAYHNHLESESQDTDKPYFWIDTLCLPLRPAQWRKAAIKQMRYCYENASAVLVLDRHLRRSTGYTPTKTELLLQIAISDWRFRVWTLQEAVFAKKLIFQFVDISAEADELLTTFFHSSHLGKYYNMDMLISNILPSLGSDMESQCTRDKSLRTKYLSLAGIMSSLQGRAISKPEDEPLCAASLLGQDHVLSAILEWTQKKERMKVFWRSQARIPSWVPFMDGPKLEDPGYRWAPSTLLHLFDRGTGKVGPESYEYGEIHPDGPGLVIRKPGFVLLEREFTCASEGNTRKDDGFSFKDDRGSRYYIARSVDKLNPSLQELRGGRFPLAVIVSEWPDAYSGRILVVSILDKSEDEIIHCSIICRGIIIPEEEYKKSIGEKFEPDSMDSYKARRVRDDQGWLLE